MAEELTSVAAERLGARAAAWFEEAWGPRAIEALDDVAREEAQLEAVALEAIAGPTPRGVTAAVRAAAALGLLYMHRGPLDAMPRLLQRMEPALSAHEHEAEPAALARLKWMSAFSKRLLGRVEAFVALIEQAMALAGESSRDRGHMLVERARYVLGRGDLGALARDLAEARRLAHRLDDPAVESKVERVEAEACLKVDDVLGAMDHAQRCAVLADQSGNPNLQANAALMQGTVLAAQARPEEALVAFQRTVTLSAPTRSINAEAYGRLLSGIVELELGRHEAALATLERAREVGERKGETRIAAWARAYRGLGLHELGQLEGAVASYEAALPVLTALHETWSIPMFSAAQGAAEAMLGRVALAEERLARARVAVAALDVQLHALIIEVFAASLDIARALAANRAGDVAAAALHTERAQEVFARATRMHQTGTRIANRSGDLRIALRILEQQLEQAGPPSGALVVGVDGSWFQAPPAAPVDLAKKRVLRRLLGALVATYQKDPRAVATRGALVEALWPGEVMTEKSASNRVFVAIAQLRQLGLKRTILTGQDGWHLAPGTPVVRLAQPRGKS